MGIISEITKKKKYLFGFSHWYRCEVHNIADGYCALGKETDRKMDWEKQGNHNENGNSWAVDLTVWLIYQHLLCYDFVELTLDTLIWNYASLQAERKSEHWINWKKMQPDSTGENRTLGNIYFVKQFQRVAMRKTFLVATITRHWMCLHTQSETDYAWANNTVCSICFAFKCITDNVTDNVYICMSVYIRTFFCIVTWFECTCL